jgi:hypothetical protein
LVAYGQCRVKDAIKGKIEGKEDKEEDVSIYRMTLLIRNIMEIKKGRTSFHFVENLLWKRLKTCRKTDYGMNSVHQFL